MCPAVEPGCRVTGRVLLGCPVTVAGGVAVGSPPGEGGGRWKVKDARAAGRRVWGAAPVVGRESCGLPDSVGAWALSLDVTECP